MRLEECQGCVHLILKVRSCGRNKSDGVPARISLIDDCKDHARVLPFYEAYLRALPSHLIEDLELEPEMLVRFIRLVLAQRDRSSPPFWFFSDPHYRDDQAAGRLDIVDYRGYEEIEGILAALGYRFERPAGPVRDLPLPPAERRDFFRTFGAYYAVAVSAVNKHAWERRPKL